VIHRPVAFAEAGSGLDRPGDEPDCAIDRAFQGVSGSQSRSDCSGKGAPGPVCVDRVDAASPPDAFGLTVPEQVDGVTVQVSTLDQGGSSPAIDEPPSRCTHLRQRGDGAPGQDGSFLQVRRDQGDSREQDFGDRRLRLFGEEAITARRDHDGIHDVGAKVVLVDGGGDRMHQLEGPQHAGLERLRWQVRHHRVDLGSDLGNRHAVDRLDPDRILSSDRSDGACPEDAKLVERLEIRLNAGSAPAIASSDREYDRQLWFDHMWSDEGGRCGRLVQRWR